MKKQPLRTAALSLMAGLSMTCAHAASSATSSASESATSSASSASDSLTGSSNSSSRTTGVAAGDYLLIRVADSVERPGMLRMTLARAQEAATGQEVEISLPRAAFEKGQLDVGGVIAIREKAYGLELVNGRTQEPFFLVLADDWFHELGVRPVVL